MGPTASGKTALAIALRKVLPVELISVDSALIYRGMDIGTAKPDAAELSAAPHRLLDILDPAEAYSAADFRRDALAATISAIAASFGVFPIFFIYTIARLSSKVGKVTVLAQSEGAARFTSLLVNRESTRDKVL